MNTIYEAISKVQNIHRQGWRAYRRCIRADPELAQQDLEEADRDGRRREHLAERSTGRSGLLTVMRVSDRSVGTCPYCGAPYNAGSYVVRHSDGRELRFSTVLDHYARQEHPITPDDVDTKQLLALMADV